MGPKPRKETDGSSVDPEASKPELPDPAAHEIHVNHPEDSQDIQNDLPTSSEPTNTEAVTDEATVAVNIDPPNPLATNIDNREVIITGTSYTAPETSNVLTKVVAKDEAVLQEKGKAKLELPNYESFSVEDLHVAYLDRLATSREMEIGLVSMMKNKYKEAFKTAESNVANLKRDLERGQTSQAKVEEKLRLSLLELGNTKAGFLRENKSFEDEKTALVKRAEDAEDWLKPITEELSGLKRHIAQMTQAIFGLRTNSFYDNSLLMLKAVYSRTEQLYTGSHLAVKATLGEKQPLKYIKNVLENLSIIPRHIPELKRSAARSGAIYALSRALAYTEEIDPNELAKGFLEFKNDGSEFSQEDYAACVKDAYIMSTQLVFEMKPRSYQVAYGANHTRIPSPDLITKNLAP